MTAEEYKQSLVRLARSPAVVSGTTITIMVALMIGAITMIDRRIERVEERIQAQVEQVEERFNLIEATLLEVRSFRNKLKPPR